MQVNIQKYRA